MGLGSKEEGERKKQDSPTSKVGPDLGEVSVL